MGTWWEVGTPLALARLKLDQCGGWCRGNISVTNEWAIESSLVSMGSRWGRRRIPGAWPQRYGWWEGGWGGGPVWGQRWGRGRRAAWHQLSPAEKKGFWGPDPGAETVGQGKATVCPGPLCFFLLVFQGPYFSVIPFLPHSPFLAYSACASVSILPAVYLLFLPALPSQRPPFSYY